ncbi:putative hydrolase [Aeropyrum pernix]|uniref:Putative hydrolase n=1 Tax=Aeropyrum pernix TaxID=56636 RepID=A0A401HBR2_AERPX|nr:amidohydrolase family protein [Aeropyrum pernix]GBF09820.1 putative hydrolase [Aeropyrum pernix]
MLSVRVDYALVGRELEAREAVCLVFDGSDGRLSSISSSSSCPESSPKFTIAVPPSANAHIHSSDVQWPEVGNDLSLEELVAPPRGLKHLLLQQAGERACAEAAVSVYRALGRMGVRAAADFREPAAGGCLPVRETLATLGGLYTRVVLMGRPGDPYGLEGCDGIGLNSPLDVDPKRMRLLRKSGMRIHAHVAETREMRLEGDLEAALDIGVDTVIHGTHLSREDLELLREHGVTLVLSPRSNMWHGVGLPPVAEAYRVGVKIAFGTDNAAWNMLDPWDEARQAMLVARLQGVKDPGLPHYILKGLLSWGYEALGIEPPALAEGADMCSVALMRLEGYEAGVFRRSFSRYYTLLKIARGDLLQPVCTISGGLLEPA